MSTLERAIEIAAAAHAGQIDKAGQPYILHPLRVMMKVDPIEAKIVAVLHDTVEDTPLTLASLRQEGFSETIMTVLDLLTHRPEETYEAYIRRLQVHPLAVQVKLLDLEDNRDVRRLSANLTDQDRQRLEKYEYYWNLLQTLPAAGPAP